MNLTPVKFSIYKSQYQGNTKVINLVSDCSLYSSIYIDVGISTIELVLLAFIHFSEL